MTRQLVEPPYRGTLTPEHMAIVAKAERDMLLRLDAKGMPLHPGNDYELHLCARHLRQEGLSTPEISALLSDMVMNISNNRRADYIADILKSPIVWADIAQEGV